MCGCMQEKIVLMERIYMYMSVWPDVFVDVIVTVYSMY